MEHHHDLLKRNTDCVAFMASPPTCDKGLECEFRHSKIARLNPKMCWYWLAGECLNPTCAFRHPPLEGNESEELESATYVVSANKSNVPCYFYMNGMCSKGDRCSFLHDIDGSASTGKCSNTASACTDTLPSENKASAVNETMLAPTVAHKKPSEIVVKTTSDTRPQPTQDADDCREPKKSASPHVSGYGDEEADEFRSSSLLIPAEGSIHNKSPLFTDQSSESGPDDLIVQEEWWESSPGFDVLVDGKSENFGGEDSPEYFPTLDRERWELNKEWHDFDNPVYDPLHPGAELLYENQIFDSMYRFDNESNICGYAEDRMLDSILSRKRKLMPMEVAVDDQDDLDLRDHLRRRRLIDVYSSSGLSRMHDSLQLIGGSQEWPQRHDAGWQRRLASEVENRSFVSHRENESFNSAGIQHRPQRHSQHYRSRKHQERRLAKPQVPSSGFSRRPTPREKRSSTEDSTIFTGPKSLAQIREEKRKGEENGCGIRKSRCVQRTRDDFQGPKPLSEILKEKRKLADRSSSGRN